MQKNTDQKESFLEMETSNLLKLKRIKDPTKKLIQEEKFHINYNLKLEQNLIIDYPDNLPIHKEIDNLKDTILKNQVVIVMGHTGSGKTTQLPKIALDLGFGKKGLIGHTQPRRIAASSVASRLAQETQSELGVSIGYQVRFHKKTSDLTRIKVMTDGVLLSEIRQDKLLLKYDFLIIDEAHERSLNIDLILGYLKIILQKRKDLKIIITSATIDSSKFSSYFNNAPVLELEGKTYPVEVIYRETDISKTHETIMNSIEELWKYELGDILIFLPGESQIRELKRYLEHLNTKRKVSILPLYGKLSKEDQLSIFHPKNELRIILATNIAETSITVPRIKYVIDTGFARVSRFNSRTKVQSLLIEEISKASADQRKGRCGRLSPGVCIRLYSEENFEKRDDFTDPEILRTNLSSVILQLISLNIKNVENFPFLDKPDTKYIRDGLNFLLEIGAIESKKDSEKEDIYRLTPDGKNIMNFPIDPKFSKMLLTSAKNSSIREMLIIVSFLSILDPREYPLQAKEKAQTFHKSFQDKKSDFLTCVNLYNFLAENLKELSKNKFAKFLKEHYLSYLRVNEWFELYRQLKSIVRLMGFGINETVGDYKSIHESIISANLSQVATKVELTDKFGKKTSFYRSSKGTSFTLMNSSSIFKIAPKWIVVDELIETTKLWGSKASEIDPEWILSLSSNVVKKRYENPRWNSSLGATCSSLYYS
ncbi:MAG: ATP-dependent RNA helicase HrpA, partial [Psittacicella sp.]